MAKRLYPRRVFCGMGPQRLFGCEATQTAFLLGGIGIGNVSLGSRGDLRDWEIFNRSAKGQKLPYSFFSMAVVKGDRKPDARVLEGRLVPSFADSHGFHPNTASGLPHIGDSRLMGEYPFAYVKFEDETLLVEVSLEAYTPFIPHESDYSNHHIYRFPTFFHDVLQLKIPKGPQDCPRIEPLQSNHPTWTP